MSLHEYEQFFRLSAKLTYQLSAASVDNAAILDTILGDGSVSAKEALVLKEGIAYLRDAYGSKRRRLGPFAVLHPFRTAALLAAAAEPPDYRDLLIALLHDKFEDVRPSDFEKGEWKRLESRFDSLLDSIQPRHRSYLKEQIEVLTRREGDERYSAYVGRLVKQAQAAPGLVKVKLVDRLDNTLDLRVVVADPLEGVDFFDSMFQLLFVRNYPGYQPSRTHPAPGKFHGARRMYELFKNVITLSLIRKGKRTFDDAAADRLFEAVARAGVLEAQRIVMHIFGYHYRDVSRQRTLVLRAMEACMREPAGPGARSGESAPSADVFLEMFDYPDTLSRDRSLEALYQDKEQMVQVAVAFIVMFTSFLNDPDYHLGPVGSRRFRS